MAKIVVLDDELTMVQVIGDLLRDEGHEVLPFTDGQAAAHAIASVGPDLVITDLYLAPSRPHGMEILRRCREVVPPPVVIVITGYGSIQTAVEAMQQGAFDFVEKPFNIDHFKLAVQRAVNHRKLLNETVWLRRQLKRKYQFDQIIGTAPAMQTVFKLVERVANTNSTVLLLGESGTGKELVARALHYNSNRQLAPFVPINCSALPEALLESELFGHCRGSFTGAITDKVGLFEAADGGTIFLDEIGTMSPVLQSRLLRVLQEREIRRVGENTAIPVNVRVVAATNESLEKRIAAGTFREDLYYRLNVISIQLPSLRERRDDIPLLVSHFLKERIRPRAGKPCRVTRQTMAVLEAYDWPGNVRELENAMERAATLCESDVIRTTDLPSHILAATKSDLLPGGHEEVATLPFAGDSGASTLKTGVAGEIDASASAPAAATTLVSLKEFLRDQEHAHIQVALRACGGSKEQAALLLGISLPTLYRKLGEAPNVP